MGKEKFTGPFWALLIVSVVAFGGYTLLVRVILGKLFFSLGLKLLLYYPWPILGLVEGVIYWQISKRNVYRKDSWAHVLLFSLAAAFSILRVLFVFALRTLHVSDWYTVTRALNLGSFALFWLLIIGAHIYFFLVLRKTFSKRRPAGEGVQGEDGENPNLLDDVLY